MKEEKAKEMEEKEQRRLEKRRQEEDEERRKEKQEEEDEQSQSLFEIHRQMAIDLQVTGHTMRRENAIGFPCKKLKKK